MDQAQTGMPEYCWMHPHTSAMLHHQNCLLRMLSVKRCPEQAVDIASIDVRIAQSAQSEDGVANTLLEESKKQDRKTLQDETKANKQKLSETKQSGLGQIGRAHV